MLAPVLDRPSASVLPVSALLLARVWAWATVRPVSVWLLASVSVPKVPRAAAR